MANPTADYPTAIHTGTDVPALASSKLGTSSPKHTEVEGKQEAEIIAVQTKVGSGSSTPGTKKILKGTATGVSTWTDQSEIFDDGVDGYVWGVDPADHKQKFISPSAGAGENNTLGTDATTGVSFIETKVGTVLKVDNLISPTGSIGITKNSTDKVIELELSTTNMPTVPLNKGGTGATNASGARSSLELDQVTNNPQVALQASTPGTAQTGNSNITGKEKSGSIETGSAKIGTLSGVLKATTGTVSGSATTDDLTEGSGNLYLTNSRVRANRLDQMAAPAADVSMNSNKITNVSDALSSGDAPNWGQVSNLLAANDAMVFKGGIDASANPNYPAADAGHTYKITNSGKIGGSSGAVVEAGDVIMCTTDSTVSGNQATVGTYWVITQANLDGAVIGPASAVSGNFASFGSSTGKTVADSGYSASSFATPSDLTAKENTITAGTTSQYYRGDKTFQTLDKTAVGLGNVDNTSDANKPVSTAQAAAIAGKQTLAFKTIGDTGADYTSPIDAITAGFKNLFVLGTLTWPDTATISTADLNIMGQAGASVIVLTDAKRMVVSGARFNLTNVTIDINSTTNLASNDVGLIHITGAYSSIRNCYFDLAGVSTATTGVIVYAKTADYFDFSYNRINGGADLQALIVPNYNNRVSRVANNVWTGLASMGFVYVNDASADITGLNIENNEIRVSSMNTAHNLIHLASSLAKMNGVKITGNNLFCAGTYAWSTLNAIYLYCAGGSLSTEYSAIVSNNLIRKSGSIPVDFGIALRGMNNVLVTGNSIGTLYLLSVRAIGIIANHLNDIYTNNNSTYNLNISNNNFMQGIDLGAAATCEQSTIVGNRGQGSSSYSMTLGYLRNCIVANNIQFGGLAVAGGTYSIIVANAGYGNNAAWGGTLSVAGTYMQISGNRFGTVTNTSTSQIAWADN